MGGKMVVEGEDGAMSERAASFYGRWTFSSRLGLFLIGKT